jgi:heterodisulfide reductase subunit A
MSTELVDSAGFKGNFISTLVCQGQVFTVKHGATLIATGGVEYKGREYSYGQDSRILTQLEFEALLAAPQSALQGLKSVAMIQCIGPRRHAAAGAAPPR